MSNMMCSCCGFTAKTQQEKINNFYSSKHELFTLNKTGSTPRMTTCKNCINRFYQKYMALTNDKEFAMYQVCAKTGWYYDLKTLNLAAVNLDVLAEYVKLLNTGPGKGKTFEHNITEDYKEMQNQVLKEENDDKDISNSSEVLINEDVEVEKIYSVEWIGEYEQKEIDYLDNYYAGLLNDYKIITENHRDYARKIAKASLFMDKMFEDMMRGEKGADIVYNKARDTFDKLCQSAKFAESSRSINDVGLGCFGKIAERVENGSYIYKHLPIEKDQIDDLLDAFNTIEKSL